ncbi:hypothetical protein [Ornithinimicrobium cavernae]|uniref:hypothetical protein n=1 Tax=Ornithinimicrobium cavernae TaxID=2666047 RepID=UPI000D68A805|nr:hypothetical protein [Ornithinimicrobium cavernae]
MSVPLSASDRIGTVRRLHRDRTEGRTQADTAFWAYVVVLLLAMVVVPLVLGIASVLAEPEVLAALRSDRSDSVVAAAAGCLLAAAAVLGAHRGPAHLPPFLVTVLAGNDLPRARTLARPFVTSAAGLTLVVTAAAALPAVVLLRAGGTGVAGAVAFVAGSACLGAVTATAWLAGQRIGPRHGWVLPVALLAATALTAVAPALAVVTPWGWVADLWPPTAQGSPWALLPLALVTLVCLDAVPRLLNRLRGPLLLDQAGRWEIVGTAAYTGDFAAALAMFRARPRLGRAWWAVPTAPAPIRYAVRDLVGALRTPVRGLTGLFFLGVGGFLTGLAVAGTALPAWLLAGVGAVATYAGLGTVTDGFRHAADTRSAPALYGYGTAELFGLHALTPVLLAVAGTVAGAVVAQRAGWEAAGLLEAGLLGILLVVVRAYDSAKGMLPLILLTPAPSPAGDLSGLMVLAWQADALLISITLAVTLALATTAAGLLMGLGAAILGGAVVIALTAWRLRQP